MFEHLLCAHSKDLDFTLRGIRVNWVDFILKDSLLGASWKVTIGGQK
jgi:hypothetical protein